ncbi:MAG: hypothetical protein U7127_25335 [Phormidium sp.]
MSYYYSDRFPKFSLISSVLQKIARALNQRLEVKLVAISRT